MRNADYYIIYINSHRDLKPENLLLESKKPDA